MIGKLRTSPTSRESRDLKESTRDGEPSRGVVIS
jgi:hypothetical protein